VHLGFGEDVVVFVSLVKDRPELLLLLAVL
jgi:hypothetical protein